MRRSKGAANVLFLTYEADEVRHARAAIIDVARFLGSPACETAAIPAKLERVVEASSFAEHAPGSAALVEPERRPEMPEFVRKGAVGDWRDLFSPDQARRLAERFAQRPRAPRRLRFGRT